ncbi:type 1 glutamine amidotransferase domain-containing protein [Rhizobium sp. C1]|uniref:type 1 glutamine amidotransferase domain-containing protein n=1 Tax=Rhizobium sp. C1 TaxID=1349799 RepID=UPI001E3D79E5|nr:type 1 glutamine amidotransferase domain-containing protein [Rhizobium sp. C1]MCD2176946.1 type 1 glutamine amidotransferase [Rhizobium sp. C1]
MPSIDQAKILIISANGFEQSELMVPLEKLKQAGATVHVATPDGQPVKGWKDKNWGDSVNADLKISDARVDQYDALVIPGGQMNPDILRTEQDAVSLVRKFADSGKVIAAICHGPWMLVEAGVIKGREATSYSSIKTDMVNAGARWSDVEVATDEGIITSRSPKDLEAFVAKIIEEVGEGRHDRRAA